LNQTTAITNRCPFPVFAGKTLLLLLAALLCGLTPAFSAQSQDANNAEERVTFYPTYGYQQDSDWIIPIRIWVHEKPDLARRKFAEAARIYIGKKAGITDPSEEQKRRFENRTRGFIADSESRERVVFVFDNDPDQQSYRISNGEGEDHTDRNGGLEGSIRISKTTAARLLQAQQSNNGWLRFRAVSDDHWGIGYVRLIPPAGVSVISDIDDTIKITGIPEGEAVVLRNTFFREFAATPCMAPMYNGFGESTAFHYVSGGPWQMYQPLADFLFSEQAGFPRGSLHMKNLRTNPFAKESYQDIWRLVANGSQQATFDQKVAQIRSLLTRFPGRKFILIGDSGEKDPEVFAQIRREFPSQIEQIIIRAASADRVSPARLEGMTLIPYQVSAPASCSAVVNQAAR
jgi:glutathione peroxidase-family protein